MSLDPYLSLHNLIEKNGVQICADKRRMKGILYDIFPHSAETERNILIYALDDGIVEELLDARKDDKVIEISRLIEHFSRKRGMKHSLAKDGILSWGRLTGYIREEDNLASRITQSEEASVAEPGHPKVRTTETDRNDPARDTGEIEAIDPDSLLADMTGADQAEDPKIDIAAVLVKRGEECLESRQYENALTCFCMAIKKDPLLVNAWRLRGLTLMELGNLDEADDALELALSYEPQNSALRIGKGMVLIKKGRFSEALKIILDLLRTDPQNSDGWAQAGRSYQGMRRYQEAIQAFLKCLEIKPGDMETRYYLGTAYEDNSEFEQAIGAYNEILAIKPRDKRALHNKAKNLLTLNRNEEAAGIIRTIR